MDDATAARTVNPWPDLCLFLGGSTDSFTGVLLGLIAKADPGNRAKLRGAFPREVAAWEEWQAHAPLSWGDLDRLTTARAERPWRDDFHLQCGEVTVAAASVMPVTIYLPGGEGHEQVEAAVEALLDSAGLEVTSREESAGDGFGELPVETRRDLFGWFGVQPWPSGVCYAEDGRLLVEMRKPFPAGESCLYCGEEFSEAAGDQGKAVPQFGDDSVLTEVRHAHKECMFMQVAGPLAHHQGRCRCHGGTGETPGMTARQEALEVWRLHSRQRRG